MEYLQDKFPWPATKNLQYPIIENIEWTNGFWTGMLWLCYEYTGDEKFRKLADRNVDSFLHRVENKIELDHHDLGFLYSFVRQRLQADWKRESKARCTACRRQAAHPLAGKRRIPSGMGAL